ncbi:MAG: hypothetical protein Kow009_06370 [Spirochaetales bacterium]
MKRENPPAKREAPSDLSRLLLGLTLLFLFLVAGESLTRWLRLPASGSVVGMVLLAMALGSKILPLSLVEDAARILLQHLSLFFVPAGVGLLSYGALLKGNWIPISLAVIAGTVVTLLCTAWIHRRLESRAKGKSQGRQKGGDAPWKD